MKDLAVSRLGASAFCFRPPRDGQMTATCNYLNLNKVGLIHAYCNGKVSTRFNEVGYVRQYFAMSGTGRFAAGGVEHDIKPSSASAIVPAGVPLESEFDNVDKLLLRIDRDALVSCLESLIGQTLRKPLEFDPPRPGAGSSSLRRAVFHFASDYNATGANLSELVIAETERMLIMRFLMCNPHNHSALLVREAPAATMTVVRRVEEFIETNWDQPVDVETMAAVANISARSLFRQFQKERGYSPSAFAKRVRLDRAREMLERGETTVLQVAYKCGFQNPSHFSKDFKDAFGELPSVTLRKGRD